MRGWQRDSRDADLALFNEMRARQRRKFIYPPEDPSAAKNDDGLSTCGLSPSRSSHNDGALPMDANKNDYDWLLTPPTTPLFPSLDEDAALPLNLSQRRVLPRSASASRPDRAPPLHPSAQELSQKGANENHPSPSNGWSRGRPSSPSYARSTSAGRTPKCNPPAVKPSSPCRQMISPGRSRSVSRSPTPPASQCSGVSSPSASSVSVFTISGGSSRGKSLSPQLHRWDPSAAMGLSAEPPPNLRTSLPSNRLSHQRSGSQTLKKDPSSKLHSASGYTHAHVSSPAAVEGSRDQNSPSVLDHRTSHSTLRPSSSSGPKSRSSPRRPRSPETAKWAPEDPSLAGRTSPAKREQVQIAHGRMPSFPAASTKSSGRPTVPRRSPQPMFRPLLNCAPVISSRGMKQQQPCPSSEFGGDVPASRTSRGNPSALFELSSTIAAQVAKCRSKSMEIDFMGDSLAADSTTTAQCGTKLDRTDDQSASSSSLASTARVVLQADAPPREEEQVQARFPSPDPLTRHERLDDNSIRKLNHASKRSLISYERPQTSTDGMSVDLRDGSSCASNPGWNHHAANADVVSPKSICDSNASKHDDVNVRSESNCRDLDDSNGSRCATFPNVPTSADECSGVSSGETKDFQRTNCAMASDMEMRNSEFPPKEIVSSGGIMESNHEGNLGKPATLKRNVTLEEATDTILFCNSIVHELVHAATTAAAAQNEKQEPVNALSSRREFVTLFGFSGAGQRGGGWKAPTTTRTQKRQQEPVTSAHQQRSVQKQRMKMVHRQSAAITMQQSPMEERIENAVMGNLEAMQNAEQNRVEEEEIKRAQCRCGCWIM